MCTSANLQKIIRISEVSSLTTGSCLGILDSCWCSLVSVNICVYGHLDTYTLLTFIGILKDVSVCNYVNLYGIILSKLDVVAILNISASP